MKRTPIFDWPITPEQLVFGPEIISDHARERRAEGRVWAEGYTQGELDDAQSRFGLTFPPDLVALFREKRPVLGWDWRRDDEEIRFMLAQPLEGLLFDVEHANLWWAEWGERPAREAERVEVLRFVVARAPKLVPLVSHRYIPCEPNEANNPVFSIYQSDVIIYGADLADCFAREFGQESEAVAVPSKHIPFWSDLVERAHAPSAVDPALIDQLRSRLFDR